MKSGLYAWAGASATASAAACANRFDEPIADSRADQVEKMPLDPVTGEVVRDREHERALVQLPGGDIAEPGAERRVVERSLEPVRYLGPEAVCCQLLLARQRRVNSSLRGKEWRA
jgi:uncharacterized protein (DUF427 family)